MLGQSIGRYHIVEKLGEGGMATVYKAYDTRLEREVALKVLLQDRRHSEKFLKRFEREARALAQLSHPNIVKVLDYGEHEGMPYLVMEYIAGRTLKEKMGTPLPYREAANLLAPVARALEYVHQHKIVHRDVKPANILITESGQPMLSDFGIAKMLEAEETMDLTGTGVGVGTPEYMAPEQGLGKGVDHRADIYALGIVFYELITGRKPFRADTPMAVVIKQINEPLPRPKQFARDTPDSVERVLFKALAKNVADRFEDMGAFAQVLEQLAQGSKVSVGKLQAEMSRFSPLMVGVAVLAIVMIMSVFAAGGWNLLPESIRAAPTLAATGIAESTTFFLVTPVVPTLTLSATLDRTAAPLTQNTVSQVYIPAGSFLMGSKNDDMEADADEKPEHNITLASFEIDKTEVTVEMFAQFVNATQYRTDAERQGWGYVLQGERWEKISGAYWRNPFGSSAGIDQLKQHPVTQMSWNDAFAYCAWLGKRLPTEAEWEKAARGVDGKIFPWGNYPPADGLLNFADQSLNTSWAVKTVNDTARATSPVGSYLKGASTYGVLDMAGNAWEWVADWYDASYYASSTTNNPTGPASGQDKVARGGSWSNAANLVRSTYRLHNPPNTVGGNVGFRCAR